MSMWLVLVLIAIHNPRGLPDAEQVVFRELIVASSPSVCQTHATKRADEWRAKHEADVSRLKAKVVGVCTPQKETL